LDLCIILYRNIDRMTDRDIEYFFSQLDELLSAKVQTHFFKESKKFRSILDVIDVIGHKPERISRSYENEDFFTSLRSNNKAYDNLIQQKNIVCTVIEEVVKFQHGGLNTSVDTMTEVITGYKTSFNDVKSLRLSLTDIQVISCIRRNIRESFTITYLF